MQSLDDRIESDDDEKEKEIDMGEMRVELVFLVVMRDDGDCSSRWG